MALDKRQQPRTDHMPMEERPQATMAGHRQTFGQKQGRDGIKAGIVETVHSCVSMAAIEQHYRNPEEIADRPLLMDVRKNVDGSEFAPAPAGR